MLYSLGEGIRCKKTSMSFTCLLNFHYFDSEVVIYPFSVVDMLVNTFLICEIFFHEASSIVSKYKRICTSKFSAVNCRGKQVPTSSFRNSLIKLRFEQAQGKQSINQKDAPFWGNFVKETSINNEYKI